MPPHIDSQPWHSAGNKQLLQQAQHCHALQGSAILLWKTLLAWPGPCSCPEDASILYHLALALSWQQAGAAAATSTAVSNAGAGYSHWPDAFVTTRLYSV